MLWNVFVATDTLSTDTLLQNLILNFPAILAMPAMVTNKQQQESTRQAISSSDNDGDTVIWEKSYMYAYTII